MGKKLYDSFWSSDLTISSDDWTEIEGAGEINLSDDSRGQLLSCMAEYKTNSDMEKSGVRTGKVKAVLRHLADEFSKMNKTVSEVRRGSPPEGRLALREMARAASMWSWEIKKSSGQHPYEGALIDTFDKAFFDDLQHRFNMLIICANRADNRLSDDRGGPSGDPHIGSLLRSAHGIFQAAGGDGIYTTQSLNFLDTVCRKVGAKPQSQEAIAQRLKQALSRSEECEE